MKTNRILTFLFLVTAFVTQGQIEERMVAYYPFEDGKARDVTRRGGNGKMYGKFKSVPGVKGDALYFNGGDNNIIFEGKVNRYLRGKKDFSISFYFRSDDLNQQSSILSKRTRCDGYKMFDLRLKGERLTAELYERVSPKIRCNVIGSVRDASWHHYVYIRKGNTTRLFIDGRLVDSSQLRRIIPIDDRAFFGINSSPCRRRNGTRYLQGSLDELKIFSIALTEQEVAFLFEQNLPSSQTLGSSRLPRQQQGQLEKSASNVQLQKVFGEYSDPSSQSQLLLEPQRFILTIQNPEGYKYDQLTYTGQYKIEEGDLYLMRGEVVFTDRRGAEDRLNYKQKIVGELFKDGIDLFAFETRMQLRK